MHRLLLLIPTLLLLAACGTSPAAGLSSSSASGLASAASGRLQVVATTTQVGDFTRNVSGDRADVRQLLGPNLDPHDYEASPADVLALSRADLVVVNGVGLESGWLPATLRAAGFAGTVVDTSKGVQVRAGDGTGQEPAGDPHIWHDPQNAKIMVATIATALSAAEPADAAEFGANAAAYTAKLDALDVDIRAKIDTVPVEDRKLVTNHDAFGYYLARYGLQSIGSIIPSFDSSAGLSGAQLSALVSKIRATGAKAVFSESSLPANAAQALAKEAGVAVEAGEDSLYGDTLGPAGSAGATYLQMEEHNTDTIVGALR